MVSFIAEEYILIPDTRNLLALFPNDIVAKYNDFILPIEIASC